MTAAGQPGGYPPWPSGQVRVAREWPARRGQLVSLALSPGGDRLATSMGSRLSVSGSDDSFHAEYRIPVACAPSPGLTWSPDGARLAFRDGTGQGRLVDLSGALSAVGAQARIPFLGAVSALAFVSADRLAILAPSLPGQMTLRLIRPGKRRADMGVWEQPLPRNRQSGSGLEGVNLAVSPDGSRLACTAGTSSIWVFDAATGRRLRQFDGHSQSVAGLAWVDNELIVSAATDATLQVWHLDDAAPACVVKTVAAAGMTFVRERGTALIWSARGDLQAWSLGQTPVQLWYRDPPSRSLAAHFTSMAVSAVNDLLALVDAGSTELVLVSGWDRTVGAPAPAKAYANAKVLMLGDSGAGESGLAIPLSDDYQPANGTDQATAEMNASADALRQAAAASAVLAGKEAVAEYDVFLCHNWQDKSAVRRLAQQLRQRGLRPWLDERQLPPGQSWQPLLQEIIVSIPAAAVIVGPHGLGPWQNQELDALMRQSVQGQCRVVPVLLPGAVRLNLPLFLGGLTWVDLAITEPDPLDQLKWGITGRQPEW